MSTRSDAVKGVILIIAASAFFGVSGPFAKALFGTGLTPVQVTWLRLTGSAIVLVAAALPLLRQVRRLPFWGLIAFGLTAIAGVQAFYFLAVSRIPVGIALLLEFMGPVVVVAWIRFVRRTRLPRTAVIGTLLSVAGLAVVVEIWTGLRLDTLGLLAGAAAAACQAGYFLGGEKLTEQVNVRVLLAFGFVIGSLTLAPLAAPWSMDWGFLAENTTLAGTDVPAALTLAGLVVSTALAYATGLPALRLLSAPIAGGMAYAEVVVAALAAWLLLGEALTLPQVIGGAIVIAGVFTAQRAVSTRVTEPEPITAV
ncbi:EamA family transporter [Stackebrandtia nassauensis]|uniref:EamA domain-containing protein n=1 Tax=Stackebrandtia nassauensis (strain DSM 44728 / CIP 108903 / NRRL B-16338 / NBRC 102104 / LLR-40K-21) TaxID=446470 RepID=D3QAQ7_STANL|nr:DMT family transporter [Stackebrandtia nassauensis]ADD44703.1 protein of unknown function DUF6 transmembrane [Stackebrandtia nassauensis DSM 44728]